VAKVLEDDIKYWESAKAPLGSEGGKRQAAQTSKSKEESYLGKRKAEVAQTAAQPAPGAPSDKSISMDDLLFVLRSNSKYNRSSCLLNALTKANLS
jgi:hypothetical protein